MSPVGGGTTSLRDPRWIALFFAFGLAISILMVAHSQVAGDQLNHLGRGWHLAMEGRWVPFGPPATKGGAQIGGMNGLLVGLPLMLWEDHRAPTAVVLLFHLVAYLLLDRLARRILRPDERFLLALLYWLNPWRLFFSGFLWNPNYLLLAGAVHLWTAWRLKRERRFRVSFLHVLTLGLAVQVHVASLMLVIASLLLWWRRYLRLHLGGAILAGLVVAGTLVPWALEVAAEPGFLPAGEGLPGWGLITVHPVLKGLAHWLRFPGLAFGHAMTCLDFSRLGGPGLDRLSPFLAAFKGIVLPLTVLLAGWCNWRLWRHRRRSWRAPIEPGAGDRVWLSGYVRWTLLASLTTFALSPTSISHWYVFPVLHAAVLPVVLAGGALLRSRRARVARRTAWAYALIMLVLAPSFAFGAPPYRCGQPRCKGNVYLMPALRSDHPMFERLGIQRTCPVIVDDPGGWWPAALEEEGVPWEPSTYQEPYPEPSSEP
ncbi:MAG: hypothetical protein ACE5EG_08440 [Thermoanaerobaculia bacterium]